MEGNFKDTRSLGELFAAMAQELDSREVMLLERIARLEERISELEEKVASLEGSASYFEDQVDGSAGEPNGEMEEAGVEETGVEEPVVGEEGLEEFESQEEEAAVEEELPEIEVELEFDFDEEDEVVVEEQPFEEVEEVASDDQAAEEMEDEVGDCREEDDGSVLVLDKVRPDWYDWEVDIPGHYIDDIREGIGLNDKILFMNELFGGSAEVFNETMDDLNCKKNLVETVEYLRERFPEWDEESDEVYRFYMTVRRRFNKQK